MTQIDAHVIFAITTFTLYTFAPCLHGLFQVYNLEHTVDQLLVKWSVVTNKILDAVKMSNTALLKLQVCQIVHFHTRKRSTTTILTTCGDWT